MSDDQHTVMGDEGLMVQQPDDWQHGHAHGEAALPDIGPTADEEQTALRHAAERGDLDAAQRLAVLLLNEGRAEGAARLFQWAAGRGDVESAYNAGVLHMRAERAREAEHWFRRAAEAGHAKAALGLAGLLQRDGRMEESLPWLDRAAAGGALRNAEFVGTMKQAQVSREEALSAFQTAVRLYEANRLDELEP